MYKTLLVKYYFFTFLFLSFTSIVIIPQNIDNTVLAKIGDNVILKNEFENRLNFYPREGIQDKNDHEGIKKELLYTLIAEKLWVNHALKTGYDLNPSVITARNVIEKMFVRDELYKSEIKNNISITDQEFNYAFDRYSDVIDCLFIHHSNRENLLSLIPLIDTINQISEIEATIKENLAGSKQLSISYGDLPEPVENIIYDIKPGQITNPIKMDNGWNAVYVIEKHKRQYKNVKENIDAEEKVRKIILRRKEDVRYDEFYRNFFSDIKVDADGHLFKLVAKELSNIFSDKYSKGIFVKNNSGEEIIQLDSEDLRSLETNLGSETLKKDFIKFNNNPINLITFLREISFQSFSVSSIKYDDIKHTLNKTIKEYIKNELLAREGYRKGLNELSSVKYWVKIWYENFLYQAIRNDRLKYGGIDDNSFLSKHNVADIKQISKTNSNETYKDFVEKTISLSEEYDIYIDQEIYESVSQGNINLFVLRNLGFGGRIAGVPSSPVFIDWFLEKQKKDLQNL